MRSRARRRPVRVRCLALLVAGSWWASGGGASAQQPPAQPPALQETVVVTGSATPVAFGNLTRTVRVISQEEIARLPARSVADLLRLLANVDVRARGPRGVQTDFTLRGAGFGQALVLVDGLRLNNAQSGHHNGDIPVLVEDIERIEVLAGPGSALFGADAFGGTINVITKRGRGTPGATLVAGSHGLVDGSASGGFKRGRVRQSVSVGAARSSGFMVARDFQTVGLTSRTEVGRATTFSVAALDKEFGANGFYGPSPSREWTTQTMVSAERRFAAGSRVDGQVSVAYRTHRDRFLWNETRPGEFENRHRTHAVDVVARARWRPTAQASVAGGVEQAGDWIRSSNLGDHDQARTGGFVEAQVGLGQRVVVSPALRVDRYSTFGTAWSPALGVSAWAGDAVHLRASAGRAFRVPTFTERFYTDPAHRANAALGPERAWSVEGGLDWFPADGWVATAGVFSRWERDVIDWVRASPADRWQTTNVHRIRTAGAEVGVKRLGAGWIAALDYAWLSSEADRLVLLSKYSLDFARHSVVMSGGVDLPWQLRAGGRVDVRGRVARPAYALVDARLGRRVGPAEVFLEGANLFNADYEEIRGVAMPGRAIAAGLRVGY